MTYFALIRLILTKELVHEINLVPTNLIFPHVLKGKLSSFYIGVTISPSVSHQDMLAFLHAEGSWTRGIFRRPAGARAVRELRDTLDSGRFQLPLTRDHVFVIAGVFKVRPPAELE